MDYINNFSLDMYPKYLRAEELQNPILNLEEFFLNNSLPGHHERLKKWRKSVLSEAHYLGDQGNPEDLVFIHEINIRLIEAAFLLLQLSKNPFRQEKPNL